MTIAAHHRAMRPAHWAAHPSAATLIFLTGNTTSSRAYLEQEKAEPPPAPGAAPLHMTVNVFWADSFVQVWPLLWLRSALKLPNPTPTPRPTYRTLSA
jgi:hypothetical protein